MVQCDIACDVEHPGLKQAIAAKAASLAQDFDKDILDQILTVIAVPCHLEAKLVNGLVMSLEKSREAGCVAIGDPLDQLFVCYSSHRNTLDYGYNDDRKPETLHHSTMVLRVFGDLGVQ